MTSLPGTVLIYIEQWEYQCCGTPINVGDTVALTVHQSDWSQPWWPALGQPVSLIAGHHEPRTGSIHVRVRVERLWEASAYREQQSGDDTWYLVPDSGQIAGITSMKVWDTDWQPTQDGAWPEGWIVQATILGELPPQPDGSPYGAR
ncbi:DUF6578 domain-containing protein [Ornithinimicrobium sufpigmenti]|uniref:DUF6578 domain-containing protein n=1 Tax=Ornithinimicrobium sufpigmenti TaxID=2508882 RepID=UPI003CE5B074